jgi:hypothetical protein
MFELFAFDRNCIGRSWALYDRRAVKLGDCLERHESGSKRECTLKFPRNIKRRVNDGDRVKNCSRGCDPRVLWILAPQERQCRLRGMALLNLLEPVFPFLPKRLVIFGPPNRMQPSEKDNWRWGRTSNDFKLQDEFFAP